MRFEPSGGVMLCPVSADGAAIALAALDEPGVLFAAVDAQLRNSTDDATRAATLVAPLGIHDTSPFPTPRECLPPSGGLEPDGLGCCSRWRHLGELSVMSLRFMFTRPVGFGCRNMLPFRA
jgi:hypothetical protein